MRIGIDSRGIRDGFKGGVGEYTQELLQNFALQSQDEFEVISSGMNTVNTIPLPKHLIDTRIKLPNKYLNTCLKMLKRPYLDSFFQKRPDVIFMPNWNITAVHAEVPLVVTVHDASFNISPEVFSQRMQIWHRWIEPKHLLHRASQIVAVSHSTKQDLRDIYNIHNDKITVIYPGIHPTFFNQDVSNSKMQALRLKYRLPEKFLLYLGTIEPRKNIQLIIKSFENISSKYPNLDLVIAGKDGWKCHSIHKEIQKSSIKHRIHRIGFVDPLDKPLLYRMSQIFIYPSLYEGFGFPPLEAMASGVPTITSTVSAFPEVVENAAIKVSPYDVYELSFRIQSLLDSSDLYSYYKKIGCQQVRHFSWDRCTNDILTVLRETAKSKLDA